ncbi:MAG TPA: hypothetical protein VNT99_02705, partial [Methylomirabilota bacterium]|nr:hypothetical protein [Methylomirabilota bacterium]
MKRIVLITTAASLLAPVPFCSAQRSTEPAALAATAAGVAPGTPEGPPAVPPRASRKPAIPSSSPPVGATFFTAGSRGDSIPPVMIRFSPSDAKASAALEEDIFVMARVISRTLERADRDSESTTGDRVNYRLGVPML